MYNQRERKRSRLIIVESGLRLRNARKVYVKENE
jgi:hypothetical protein